MKRIETQAAFDPDSSVAEALRYRSASARLRAYFPLTRERGDRWWHRIKEQVSTGVDKGEGN